MRHLKVYEKFSGDQIGGIFKSINMPIDADELIPMEDMVGTANLPSEEEFDEIIQYLDVDQDFLFYDPNNVISPFIYWKDNVYVELHAFKMEVLKMFHAKEHIKQKTEKFDKYIKANRWADIYMFMENKVIIPQFKLDYDKIPDNQKYEIFIDLYQNSEYGFELLPKDMVLDLFQHRKKSADWKKRMLAFNKVIKKDENGNITIYRGTNLASTNNDNAFSWTLSMKTAKFFANRFNKNKGRIEERKIKPAEVIDYLESRNESEVILLPKKYK